MTGVERITSYGEQRAPTPVDRLGVWLSSRAVRKHGEFAGRRVADFGCGYEAAFARTLADTVGSLTLVDVSLSPDLVAHPRISAVEGSLPGVLDTLPDASFDVILCLSVLEHLREPQPALDGFHRLLAPGGVVLLNVPNWRGKVFLELAAFRLGVSPAEEMDDHKAYYDPRDLWPMVIAAGFRPRHVKVFRHKLGLNTFAVCRGSGA